MSHNMGKKGGVMRVAGGLILFFFGWLLASSPDVYGAWATAMGVFGVLTAILGFLAVLEGLLFFDPVYSLLKINTCKACRKGQRGVHEPV